MLLARSATRNVRPSLALARPSLTRPSLALVRHLSSVLPTNREYEDSVQVLSDRFFGSFNDTAPPLRQIGREAEYPVVWADGTAADVRLLLATMGASYPHFRARHEGGFDRLLSSSDTQQLVGLISDDVEFSLEVGWGTVEIITGPHPDLFETQRVHEESMSMLVSAADSLGMHVLGYGIQPRTAPSKNLMSPRGRYTTMRKAIGPGWKTFTVTASDQVDLFASPTLSIQPASGYACFFLYIYIGTHRHW
jgi:hypothetical protein